MRFRIVATVALAVAAVVGTVLLLRESQVAPASSDGLLVAQPVEPLLPQLPEALPTALKLSVPVETPPPVTPTAAPVVDAVEVFEQMRRHLIAAIPPHDVLVHVVDDAHGEPVADASVEVWPSMDGPGPDNNSHFTDATGNCRLAGVSGGAVLFASKKGVGTSGRYDTSRSMSVADMREVESQSVVLKLRPVGRLTGRVLSARGAPLPGAEVSFTSEVMLNLVDGAIARLPPPTLTNAEGRFDIEVDAPFFADGVATFEGEQTPASIFAVDPGEREEEDLRFAGGYSVAGRVLPVPEPARADIRVHAFHEEEGQHTSTVVEADGAYRVDLPKPGDYRLYARAADMIEAMPLSVHVDDTQPSAQQDLRIVAMTSIRGRVVDESGNLVPTFTAQASGEDPVTGRTDWDDVIGDAFLMDIEYRSNGLFELEPVSSERDYGVYLMGQYDTRLRHIRGGTEDVELVQLDRSKVFATVRGSVTDAETGAPVTHFKLDVPGATSLEFDDPQGRYELEDLRIDNEWTITASALGFESLTAEPIWLQPGDATIDFRLGKAGGLRIAVTDAEGHPAAGAVVEWLAVGSVGLYSDAKVVHAVANDDGVVEVRDVPPGDGWLLAALGPQRAGPVRMAVPAGRTGTGSIRLLDTQPSGRIEVEITNADAETLQGLAVVLVISQRVCEALRWGHELEMPPLPDGTAIFDDIPAGLYAVCLRRDPEDETYRRVMVEPGGRHRMQLKAP